MTSSSPRGRHVQGVDFFGRLMVALRPSEVLRWLVVVLLAGVLWPAQFGGSFGMVIVAGTSMEPTYELGDSVITWREHVDVGDVVAFQVPDGDFGERNVVIHRVVGGDSAGWITQGDNSARPDQWRPSSEDVLGVAQFHLPLGGEVLALMRNWLFISVLGGIATVLLIWPNRATEDLRRRGRHVRTRKAEDSKQATSTPVG